MQNTLRLVTLLAWGLWIPAYAQTPTFSVPPIPGTETNSAMPASPAAPKSPTSSLPMPPALPGLEKLTEATKPAEPVKAAEDTPKEAAENASTAPSPSAAASNAQVGPIPYTVAPPPLTLDNAPAEPAPAQATIVPPPLPGLALPAPPVLDLAATAIPETKTEPAKKAEPTWNDVLKPSYKPMETKFNFRRQVMPSTIYRAAYSRVNNHLPTARTYESYDHAFILAAARNDVNGVRAMLYNGHRNVNLMNAEGDSVLLVALRHGALATARVLIANGADVNMSGSNGWNAMDYANYWGDPELTQAVQNGA